MSSVTVGVVRTNSLNISGTGDFVLSFRQGRLIQKSPLPDGLTDTGIWSKTYGQGSRRGGLLQQRYEKTAASFLSVILIAATADYIKA